MSWSQFQYDDYERRRHQPPKVPVLSENQTASELKLHDEIIAWCNRQNPRIKYIHARTDRKSTIGVGVHDFTIFLNRGRVLCIECKSKTGKLDEDQQAWAMEMRRLGHIVFVVRAFEEFEGLIAPLLAPGVDHGPLES